MAVTDFIVAIELGSTKITGVAGKKNADGSIRILAYASEKSSDCIKKGVIYNLDKTTQLITTVIGRLEDRLGAGIKKVYVGMGGQSVRSIRNTESKQLEEDTKISQALIDEMMKTNCEFPLVDQEILAVEPQEYKMGNNQLTTEPVGIPTDRIEGHYLNIIGRNTLKSNIRKCFRDAGNRPGYEIADYLLAPAVTAQVLLTPSEKRSGCALIDFGADTTTVSVYKNNILRHLAVIPLGGSNITKDIASQQVEEEEAEQIKLTFGSAYTAPSDDEEDDTRECSLDGKFSIRARKLEDIVEARVEEILQNVWNQIKLSDFSDKLLAGAILTGGAANLPNLEEAFTHITKIEKVRTALNANVELEGYSNLIPKDGSQNTLLGLLSAGKDNCCKLDPRKQQLDFIDLDEQKAEEEKKRKEEEEAQKKAAEEKKRMEEEEERRKQEEADRLRRLEEERKQQEQARLEKRKRDCEALIATAEAHMRKKEYKKALARATEAQNMHVFEKSAEIDLLIANIKRLKNENNPFKNWLTKLKDGADEIMKD